MYQSHLTSRFRIAGALFAVSLLDLAATYAADNDSQFAFETAAAVLRQQPNDGSIDAMSKMRTTAAIEPEIPSDDILTQLRSHGFGITGGYGRLLESKTTLATLQVRYNILQQRTTTYVNRKNALNRSAQASFGNMRKLSDFARADRSLPAEQRLTDTSDLGATASFLSGAFVWFGFTNKEVSVGAEKEKPLLAGLSLGFGPMDKGASTVHLDVGYAFYQNSKMPNDDYYIGLSIDLELFKKLVKAF